MSGSNPKYLPVPKKVQYNIRLPKKLLDNLNAYAELTDNTTTDVVIGALNDLIKDKIIYNDYLPNIKGTIINIPVIPNEKKDCYNVNLIDNVTYIKLGYYPTLEAYEILKIPNNLDEFHELVGFYTRINGGAFSSNHSGIEFVIIPEIAMEYNIIDALYCFYFEVESNILKKITSIDYVEAINKANTAGNIMLKNKLILCVNELQHLQKELNETWCDDILEIENYTYESITDIADKYNTGNIMKLGNNINEDIVNAEIKQNSKQIDEIINEKLDEIIADKVADIVDSTNFEDEIKKIIEKEMIKGNND